MPRSIPFQQFQERVNLLYSGPAHAPRTASKMRKTLALVAGLGVTTTADLTTELAARFVAARAATVTAATVRGDLAYLSAVCSLAVEEGWLQTAPRFHRVRPRPGRSRAPTVHAIADIGRLLETLESRSATWCGGRLYALAATVAYTGLRRDECLCLSTSDVDCTAGLIRIVARHRLKTVGSEAPVPIPPPLHPILHTWLPRCASEWVFPGVRLRGPWTGGACGTRACDQLRRAGEELGIAGLTLASLRHTFATHARRDWGLSDIELADVLRHTSPQTQRWYVHEARQCDLVRSVSRVSYETLPDPTRGPTDAPTPICPPRIAP